MNLLLDSAVLVWLATNRKRLSRTANDMLDDPDSTWFVSVVAIWELLAKHSTGKLPLPVSIRELIQPLDDSEAATVLPLTESAVMRLATLPDHHRDPFDRMLVCQAIDEDLTILTPDRAIAMYPVNVVW